MIFLMILLKLGRFGLPNTVVEFLVLAVESVFTWDIKSFVDL